MNLFCLLLVLSVGSDSTPLLVRLEPEQYPHFMDSGSREELVAALKTQSEYFADKNLPATYRLDTTTVSRDRLKAGIDLFLDMLTDSGGKDLNRFIRTRYDLYCSVAETGTCATRFTAYYNPEVEASLEPDDEYPYPLYRHPGVTMPDYTRKQIEEQDLLKGHEIAWLKSPFDRYALHIEGSGTLILPDGDSINAHYAGWNRQPYTSLGGEMIRDSLLEPGRATMVAIREWFEENPDRLQEYLGRNRSYVFFRLDSTPPSGSIKLPLVPERSIATDHSVVPPGMLCWAATRIPIIDSTGTTSGTKPWARFVLNHDRGAAIRGPHRADIYFGTGSKAGQIADRLNRHGRLYFLVLKENPDQN